MAEKPILFSGPIPKHIESLISPEPNSGCWLWMGACNSKGYGRLGASEMAHRAVLRTLGTIVPDGLEVDHLCRVRSCVNPAHLDIVTHQINLSRKPVPPTCPLGHSNFSIRRGKRECLECGRIRSNAAYRLRSKNERRGRRWLTDDEKQKILDLIGQGHSHSEIGCLLDVSIATVSRVRNSK